MSSTMKILWKIFPLWISKLWFTNSGTTVQRRDHVLIGVRSLFSFCFRTFFISLGSTKGPFLSERDMAYLALFFLRPRMMKSFDRDLGLRVLPPFERTPPGPTGCRPPARRPSPPPMGWSTGFRHEPRLYGR